MAASLNNYVRCVKLLLEKKAEVEYEDKVSAVSQSIIICLACSLL